MAEEYDFRRASWPGKEAVLDRISHSPGEQPDEHDVTADALVGRIGSWSQFTTRRAAECEQVLDEIRSHLTEPMYHVPLEAEPCITRRL